MAGVSAQQQGPPWARDALEGEGRGTLGAVRKAVAGGAPTGSGRLLSVVSAAGGGPSGKGRVWLGHRLRAHGGRGQGHGLGLSRLGPLSNYGSQNCHKRYFTVCQTNDDVSGPPRRALFLRFGVLKGARSTKPLGSPASLPRALHAMPLQAWIHSVLQWVANPTDQLEQRMRRFHAFMAYLRHEEPTSSPMSMPSPLSSTIELILPPSHSFISVKAQFTTPRARVHSPVQLRLRLSTQCPVPIPLSQLHVAFNHPEYDFSRAAEQETDLVVLATQPTVCSSCLMWAGTGWVTTKPAFWWVGCLGGGGVGQHAFFQLLGDPSLQKDTIPQPQG